MSYSDFPFPVVLSLRPLVERWRSEAESGVPRRAERAREVLRATEAVPELFADDPSPEVIEGNRETLDLLLSGFAPPLAGENYVAFLTPFHLTPVHQTAPAQRLDLFEEKAFLRNLNVPEEFAIPGRITVAYRKVLWDLYRIRADFDYPLVRTVDDRPTGLHRHFRVHIDSDLFAVESDDLPELHEDDIRRLLADPMAVERWAEILPPERFRFRGVAVATASEVTDQEILSRLKRDLLEGGAMESKEAVGRLEDRIRQLIRRPGIHIGLIAFDRAEGSDAYYRARSVGERSLLLGPGGSCPSCPMHDRSFYAEALRGDRPIIVHDLKDCEVCTGFERSLLDQGIRNIFLAPLRLGEETVGVLELGSERAGDLNAFNTMKLRDVLDLFAMALKREASVREDRIQAVIKRHYTAIHPSVEWRFRQAANELLEQGEVVTSPANLPPIVFDDLYPLYGLADIRSSSEIRNRAIQGDLEEQLQLAEEVVRAAKAARPLPLLSELEFRIDEALRSIESGLTSDDESGVLSFLRSECEPMLDTLAEFGAEAARKVEAYRSALDPELGVLFHRRRDFEESVSLLNQAIVQTIDREETHAQEMFPHYFERFKTDGVDYNIYIGSSLREDAHFDPLFLRNLRLWQLLLSCQIEWTTRELREKLPVPLEVTHLVLVQDQPLAIRFRVDEKKFDVDGAYNIRYEIVKKRIDKARVKGTGERLTRVGQLAVVFSHPSEGREYRRYLDFLVARGFLEGPVEELQLEDLQGSYGLHAYRVAIADRHPVSKEEDRPVLEWVEGSPVGVGVGAV